MHTPRPIALACVALSLALGACDDAAPLDLDGTTDAGAGAGGEAAGGSASGGSGGSAGPTGGSAGPTEHRDAEGRLLGVMVEAAGLRGTVMPILEARCAGPVCHTGAPAEDARFLFSGPIAELTEAEHGANQTEVVGFIDFFEPEKSDLLRFGAAREGGNPDHPIPAVALSAESEDYATIVAWIRSSVVPIEEPDPGTGGTGGEGGAVVPGGPTTIPCGGLPDTSRSRYDFATFQATVGPMLGESCSEAGCHGTQGTAGSFWLKRVENECDAKWNFFAVQWFVDPLDPAASPVLLQPLDPLHGGAEVFHGANDERYTLLRRWIENAWSGR
jgi:hypothetical protein